MKKQFAIEHKPESGEFETIKVFLNHVFQNQYDLGLDYIQLLYQQPAQKLPVLFLVSKENNTGKTTFIKFIKAIFTQHAAIIGNEDLVNGFNTSWAEKLVIAIEESFAVKTGTIERIKSFSTADKITMNAKGRAAVELDFFGKFILTSNNEDNFSYAFGEDTPYWVIKVPVITGTVNVRMMQNMIAEIPAFLHFLNSRKLTTTEESRMWFDPELIKSEFPERPSEVLTEITDSLIPAILTLVTSSTEDFKLFETEKKNLTESFKLVCKQYNYNPENDSLLKLLLTLSATYLPKFQVAKHNIRLKKLQESIDDLKPVNKCLQAKLNIIIKNKIYQFLKTIFLDFGGSEALLTPSNVKDIVLMGSEPAFDLARIFREDFKAKPYTNNEGKEVVTEYLLPYWSSKDINQRYVKWFKFKGRPFVFKAEEILTPDDLKLFNEMKKQEKEAAI